MTKRRKNKHIRAQNENNVQEIPRDIVIWFGSGGAQRRLLYDNDISVRPE